jgi:TPP-dependent pyruvate/acetoin dehydrogenase alpha subunit
MNPDSSAPSLPRPDHPTCLRLYKQMLLIRQFELAAQQDYKAGRMPGYR